MCISVFAQYSTCSKQYMLMILSSSPLQREKCKKGNKYIDIIKFYSLAQTSPLTADLYIQIAICCSNKLPNLAIPKTLLFTPKPPPAVFPPLLTAIPSFH